MLNRRQAIQAAAAAALATTLPLVDKPGVTGAAKRLVACDILGSVPRHCGHADGCEVGWHLANYWIQEDGSFTVDHYSDGDHETIDEDELPSAEDEQRAWLDYAQHVADSGADPLGEYRVPRSTQVTTRHTAVFRRRGEDAALESDPRPSLAVVDYLLLVPDPELGWVFSDGWEELISLDIRDAVRDGDTLTFPFETCEHCPRPDDVVAEELRQAARRHLEEQA